jgi:hypothetical protein
MFAMFFSYDIESTVTQNIDIIRINYHDTMSLGTLSNMNIACFVQSGILRHRNVFRPEIIIRVLQQFIITVYK